MESETKNPKPTGLRLMAILGLFALLTVIVAGSIYYFQPDTTEGSNDVVKVAYLPIYVDLPLFVAIENGYFEKRGLKVETTRFESSPLMGTALVNNEVDAVASIAYSVALSIESRDPGKFKVFIVDAEDPENYLSALVTMPDSGISSVEGLKGKKIGIFPGPTAGTFFRLLFKKHGLDPDKDLVINELSPGLHVQALTSGQVDALATYEPMATQAVVDHEAIKFVPGAIESEIINPWQAGVWILSSDFVEQNPDVAKRFIAACYEAIDFMRENPEKAKQSLNNFTGIKPHVAAKTPSIPFTKIGEVNLETFQEHADMLRDADVISKEIDTKQLLLPSNSEALPNEEDESQTTKKAA